MSIDTQGYVLTKVKDVFHVATLIESALTKLIRAKVPDIGRFRSKMTEEEKTRFSLPNILFDAKSGYLRFCFTYEGEKRMLWVFFRADQDEKHIYPGSKIILSLGAYGRSVLYIKEALSVLAHLGECYLDENDCDSKPNLRIDVQPLSFLDAILQNHDSVLNYRSWLEAWKQSASGKPLYAYLGITMEEAEKVLEEPEAIFDIVDKYEKQHAAAMKVAA